MLTAIRAANQRVDVVEWIEFGRGFGFGLIATQDIASCRGRKDAKRERVTHLGGSARCFRGKGGLSMRRSEFWTSDMCESMHRGRVLFLAAVS
jgi:hypothetical protein